MAKPATLDGYSDQYTVDCERVLVTLLRGLGPWKHSVYLVGGLTPRYLISARPPVVPAHAGTLDLDIVIDLQILADTEAYHMLVLEPLVLRSRTSRINHRARPISSGASRRFAPRHTGPPPSRSPSAILSVGCFAASAELLIPNVAIAAR